LALNTKIVNEQRLVVRLQNYWDSVRKEELMPEYIKFNNNSIFDLWESCMVFKVASAGERYVYQCNFVGEDLKIGFGKDLENRYVTDNDKRLLPGSNLAEFMNKCVVGKKVIISQGQFVNFENKIVKYRDCILPFCDNTERVSHLIVGISWKAFG